MENALIEPVKIFDTEDALYRYTARDIILLINEFTSKKGTCTLVLSGGKTPANLFRKIGTDFADKVDWDKVYIFWGDERCVPMDDEYSNYNTAYNSLIASINIPNRNIFRIHGELSPKDAADKYEETLKTFFTGEKYPSFNIMLLGLGSDGHTASLFPGSSVIDIKDKWVSEYYSENLDSWRVTLTLPVINNSRNIIFLACGEKKSSIIGKIFKGDIDNIPAGKVNPKDGKLYWYLDKKAAGGIR